MDLRKEVLYYDALVDFPANGQENKLYLNKADGALYYWDGVAYQLAGDGSGGVTSVTASAPLASSGGATPNITLTVPGNTTTFLRGDGTFATPAAGGLDVGTTAVTSGTDTRVFFQAGGVLQQSANLTFDTGDLRIGNGTASSKSGVRVWNGTTTNTAGGEFYIGTDNNIYVKTNNANEIRFATPTTNVLTIGSGNQASITRLNINGASTTPTFSIGAEATTTGSYPFYVSGLASSRVHIMNGAGQFGLNKPSNTLGAILDVSAPGALSTDIAFRVRNSADTADLISIRGTGDITQNNGVSSIGLFQRTDTTGFSLTTGTSGYGTGNGIEVVASTWILASGSRQFAFTTAGGTDGDLWTFQNNGTGAGKRMSLSKSGNETFCWNAENFSIGGNIWGNPPSETNSFGIKNGTAPTTNATDAFKLYSADITAGNAAPHFRTENGAIVKLYQETTGVGAATLVGGGGTALTDTDTFDGYTLKQIVKALRNQGLLA